MLFQLLYVLVLNPSIALNDNSPSIYSLEIMIEKDTLPEQENEVYIPDDALEPASNSSDEVFKVVESMPLFPGCESKLNNQEKRVCSDQERLKYTYGNIKYPAEARKKGIQGTAVVRFIVEKDGSLTNIELLRDPGGGCGEESLRVVQSMVDNNIKWIPGKQRGVPVRVEFMLPIKFNLH